MAKAPTSPRLIEGFQTQTDGMQSGLAAGLIKNSSYARGINVSIRGGLVRSRGGFQEQFDMGPGTFQGAALWELDDGDRLVYVMDGYIRVLNLTSMLLDADSSLVIYGPPQKVKSLSGSQARFDPTAVRCFFCQVDRFFVIQDGITMPVVLDLLPGPLLTYYRSTVGASQPTDVVYYVPGTLGYYAQGRYHYSPTLMPGQTPNPGDFSDPTLTDVLPDLTTIAGSKYFVSSDILDIFNPEFVLRMTEHRILGGGGGGLALPQELGRITAMTAMRGASTGTGVGELVVFARNGVSAFDVSSSRDQWGTVPISKVLFAGTGTLSPFAVQPVNDDIAYIDRFGQLRLLRYDKTRLAGSGGTLSNTPMSNELKYFIDLDDLSQVAYSSLVSANNRINWTMQGEPGASFKAIGSLDLALIYSMSGTIVPPAFDGVWTGFHFEQVLNIDNVLYTVVLRNGTHLLLAAGDNVAYDLDSVPIQSTLITRAMTFNDPANLKTLQFVEIWVRDIRSPVTMSVYYRPQGYNVWTLMSTRYISAPYLPNSADDNGPQFRRRVKFPVDNSSTVCNPIDNKVLWDSTEFQFAVRWTGSCGIDYFRAIADIHDEMAMDICETDNPSGATLPASDGLPDFDYWA